MVNRRLYHTHTQVSSEARLQFNLPGGHKVVVVDNFEEGLDAVSAGTLLFAHSLSDGARVSVNTSHQSMAIALGIGALVLVLQDNRLAASIFALQQQHHLAGFHDFTHFLGAGVWVREDENQREREKFGQKARGKRKLVEKTGTQRHTVRESTL